MYNIIATRTDTARVQLVIVRPRPICGSVRAEIIICVRVYLRKQLYIRSMAGKKYALP